MISSWTKGNDRARSKVNAVKQVMEDKGLNKADLILVETDYGIDQGARAFVEIINKQTRPTIIFCGNDVLAVGALKQAEIQSINIPKEIYITGLDDIEVAQIISPKLTTMHVPHRKMGKQAAKVLIKMVGKQTCDFTTKLDVFLKVRDSLDKPLVSNLY